MSEEACIYRNETYLGLYSHVEPPNCRQLVVFHVAMLSIGIRTLWSVGANRYIRIVVATTIADFGLVVGTLTLRYTSPK